MEKQSTGSIGESVCWSCFDTMWLSGCWGPCILQDCIENKKSTCAIGGSVSLWWHFDCVINNLNQSTCSFGGGVSAVAMLHLQWH